MVDKAHWLEISMTVDGELAEAVAEVIDRYVSNGVVIESGVTFSDQHPEGFAAPGMVRIFGYMAIDERIEDTKQRLLEALFYLGAIRPLPEPAFRPIVDEDWMAAWKQHYHPIPIGQRLLILPAWIENPNPSRIAVKIDPNMAFGTGTHPTTQLCLLMIEKHLEPGRAVIDVGCGSGILSIAALKLGAGKALAVDIDNAAIRSTRENAETNDIYEGLETGLGSVMEIRQGQFTFRRTPLVLANILAPVIIHLFNDGLAELVCRNGKIILSGILVEQGAAVRAAAEEHGLEWVETAQENDWIAMVLRRPDIHDDLPGCA